MLSVVVQMLWRRGLIRLFLNIQLIVMTDIVDLPNVMPLIS